MRLLWLLFDFDGRIGRLSYWLGGLIVTVVTFVPFAIIAAATRAGLAVTEMDAVSLAATVFLVVSFSVLLTAMNLAIAAKRFHDRDKSLLWYLIVFIPFIGPIWMIIELGLLPGSDGINRYGAPPGSLADGDDPGIDADAIVSRWQEKQRQETAPAPSVVERLTGPQRATAGRPQFGRRGIS